jgi:nucleotide-binding universal stress UspA family protein
MEVSAAVNVERIVAAMDFSPASEFALKYAVRFAHHFDATLTLIHVAERIGDGIANQTRFHRQDARAQIKAARRKLAALRAANRGLRKLDCLVRSGLAPHQVVETARDLDADLIVVATHSCTGQQARVGSTAEQVVRGAHCPVLAVRETKARLRKHQCILVPTDFSACAQGGIDYASALAEEAECEIVLLTVLPPGERNLTEARDKLLALAPVGENVRATIRSGTPSLEICRTAADLNADMIVMATHGETSWRHFCMGSTSEAVVNAALCPVLVVREPEHQLI